MKANNHESEENSEIDNKRKRCKIFQNNILFSLV